MAFIIILHNKHPSSGFMNLQVHMGGTDCALPMIYAKQQKLDVDVFIVYTDSETWFGKIHPSEALKDYRKVSYIVQY